MATIKPNNVIVDETTTEITFTFEPTVNPVPIVIKYDDLITQSILDNTYKDDSDTILKPSLVSKNKDNSIIIL